MGGVFATFLAASCLNSQSFSITLGDSSCLLHWATVGYPQISPSPHFSRLFSRYAFSILRDNAYDRSFARGLA
jgi:hypothetical protein